MTSGLIVKWQSGPQEIIFYSKGAVGCLVLTMLEDFLREARKELDFYVKCPDFEMLMIKIKNLRALYNPSRKHLLSSSLGNSLEMYSPRSLSQG